MLPGIGPKKDKESEKSKGVSTKTRKKPVSEEQRRFK
jgi:hypothetical protein